MGSSRADVYERISNVDQRTAVTKKVGYVQLYQRQAPLNVRPLTVVVSQLVIEHKDVERLMLYPENGRVRILIGKILPNVSAVESTLINR